MKSNTIFALALTMSFSMAANAAYSMKPGLWEHSFTMKSESGKVEKAMADMKKQMAAMPAEQRKMMEEMLAKQGMGLGSDKGSSVKVCISKEQAEKLDFPQNQNEKCKNEILKRTANSVDMKFTCEGNPKTEGVAGFNLLSPTAYTGKADITVTKDGRPDKMNMDSKGKWLSADCGNVKPYTAKK